jgi:thiamine transporter ThiT
MTDSLYCANHPQTETMLRCNRCEKPICIKCAVLTDTGYRCKECVRGQQKAFETAEIFDYPIAFVVATVLSFIGSLIAPRLSFFVIILGPIAGTIVAEAVRFSVRKRRANTLFITAAAGALIGSLPGVIGRILVMDLLGILWYGIYAFTVTTTVFYRLKGMVFRR